MAANPYRDGPEGERPRGDASELEKKVTEGAKIAVPAATLALAAIGGAVQGASLAILVLAAGALVGVIAVFWASVRTLVGETPLSGADAYALGAPRAEEEQKRAVLRALKDLEFERSVGKISEEDYQALVTKYRAEAKRLLRILDAEAQPRREHVEVLVQKRLRREGLADSEAAPEPAVSERVASEPVASEAEERAESPEQASAEDAQAKAAPSRKKKKKARAEKSAEPAEQAERALADGGSASGASDGATDGAVAAGDRICASCGTVNDADAVFCKKCGARRAPAEVAASSDRPVEPAKSDRPVEPAKGEVES